MDEFWEAAFHSKQAMWGFDPTLSAREACHLFLKNGAKNILLPGYGYGRNGVLFVQHGMNVTGIEISATAIALAKEHYGDITKIYHGSVNDMPFDYEMYDGIFSHALIHLLNEPERSSLILHCYNQLQPGGLMIFVAVSTSSPNYGRGRMISNNCYETMPGVNLYFYDEDAVKKEFGNYGLSDYKEVEEPGRDQRVQNALRFWFIVCKKN